MRFRLLVYVRILLKKLERTLKYILWKQLQYEFNTMEIIKLHEHDCAVDCALSFYELIQFHHNEYLNPHFIFATKNRKIYFNGN